MSELTLAKAADQWVAAKLAIEAAKPNLEAAEAVLKDHFRRTERTSYKGLVGFATSTYRRLDTRLAKAALGKRAEECMVPTTRETLSLLK